MTPTAQSTLKDFCDKEQKEISNGVKYEGTRDIIGVEKSLKKVRRKIKNKVSTESKD